MQDLAAPDQAFASYTAARRIDQSNVSALLNQSAMVSGGYESDMAADVRDAVRELVDGMEQKYRVWSLSRYYGYIHAPEMFSHWGWSNMMAPQRNLLCVVPNLLPSWVESLENLRLVCVSCSPKALYV